MLSIRFCTAAVAFVILLCIILIVVVIASIIFSSSGDLLVRIPQYEKNRYALFELEHHHQIGGKLQLTERELIANNILMDIKMMEYNLREKIDNRMLQSNNHAQWMEDIANTTLYGLLNVMPKGASLNVHEMALCNVDRLMGFSYYDSLWICVDRSSGNYENLRFSKILPPSALNCQWILLKELRKKKYAKVVDRKLRNKFSIINDENKLQLLTKQDVMGIVANITQFVRGMITFKPVWEDYVYYGLIDFLDNDVMYLEITTSLPTLYDVDDFEYPNTMAIEVLKNITHDLKLIYHDFIGTRFIYQPNNFSIDNFLGNGLTLKNNFHHYMAGVSFGNENNLSLREYAYKLIGERNRPKMFYSMRPTTRLEHDLNEQNLIDSVLLGFKRISYDVSLFKHPAVLSQLKSSEIVVEMSPSLDAFEPCGACKRSFYPSMSSSALLFINGYKIVLTSPYTNLWNLKDPLAYEFYLAILDISPKDAGLSILKQLAWNSINYSAMNSCQRSRALRNLLENWEFWVESIINLDEMM